MDYANLVGLGITFLEAFRSRSENRLPVEILTAVQSLIAALQAHHDDIVTKAALEAQRG